MDTEPRALALGAGGARGAFQAGALLCLAERGIRFTAVAGTSIGSVNGAFLAQGDGSAGHLERLCAVWRELPAAGVVRLNPRALGQTLALFVGAQAGAVAGMLAKLASGRLALLDPAPLSRLLDRHLDYASVCRSPTSLLVATLAEVSPLYDILTGSWRAATYLEAGRLQPRQLRAALLAAVAIPVAFPSHAVLARRHADAGLADPIPVRALYGRGARRIVAVALSSGAAEDRSVVPGASLLQLRPPPSVTASPSSILDFSRATIERLIDLGYREARAVAEEVAALANDLTALQRHGAANQALADRLPDRALRARSRAPGVRPRRARPA